MKIRNVSLALPVEGQRPLLPGLAASLVEALGTGAYPLRLSIVEMRHDRAEVEATVVDFGADSRFAEELGDVEILHPRRKAHQANPFAVVQIVPTGIRCEFGGYAGDACPATNLLASAVDFVVTHPNAVNASELNEMADNILYVEGKSLDDFLLGHVGLLPRVANRIGTFVDRAAQPLVDYVINVLNAARAAAGIDCGTYTSLGEGLGVEIGWSERGCAVGTLANPDALLEAVERLVDEGVDAVGGVSIIHGSTQEMFRRYLDGSSPNPSGGIEAIITHLISKLFRVPTAHAPLPYYEDVKEKHTFNPRASAEFISTPHYFCVLKGLHRAPRPVRLGRAGDAPAQALTVDNVGAVVAPASALGGIPALAAEYSGIPLIAVRENRTILDMTNEKIQMSNVVEVDSYLEAAGVVLALKQGLSLESLRRPLRTSSKI